MKKRSEQSFCTKLQPWLKHNFKQTCFIEAKISIDDKPFNFKSGFKPHQLPTLISARQGVFAHKLSDIGRILQPYDITFGYHTHTYVAIMWIRKGNKTFYLINPITIQGMIDDGHKSMTEERARMIADVIGELA